MDTREWFATRSVALVAIVAVMFGAVGVVTVSSASAAALQPCVRAQALLDAGYLADAQTAFKADLGKGPCALAGLAAVKSAQELANAANTANADKQFKDAVAVIRRLEAAGFESEARKQTQALVVAYPNKAIPADIRAVDQPISWWRQAGGDVGPLIRLAIEIAAVLLIMLVLGRAVVGVIARFVRASFTIKDVSGVPEAESAGECGLLATELARIGSSTGGNHVHRVSASEEDFELPAALTSAYPQAGIVAGLVSLLDRILPRKLFEVSATVLPVDSLRGAGLNVAISRRGGRQQKDITVWEAEFANVAANTALTDRLQHLMLPAAVWLAYQPEMGWDAKASSRLGTKNWKSYAYFAVGERHQQNGETRDARRSYYRALDADAASLGARLNLAGLLVYRRGHDGAEAADDPKSRQDFGWWLLTGDKMSERMTDLSVAEASRGVRWRWLYLTAAMNLARKEPAEALDAATTLWDEIRPTAPDHAAPTPAELAEEMRWPTFVLRASAKMECDRTVDPAALSAMENVWWTANTLYNLACYHARAAAYEDGAAHQHSARRYLRDSIDRATEPKLMLAMAATDTPLVEIVKMISADERVDLTGEQPPDPPHKVDVDRGRGIGLEVREAIKTLVHRDSRLTD